MRDLFTKETEELWRTHAGASVRVRAKQAVYHEGDPSDAVYLLLEGELRACVGRPDDGSEHTTLLLAPRAIFGDRDLLAGVAAQETVTALSASRILVIEREVFLAARSSEIRDALVRDLSERYALSVSWSRLGLAPLSMRVSVLLRDRGEMMPAQYLAEALSAAPKSVARALAELRDQGVLDGDRLDADRLSSIGLSPTDRAFHRFRGFDPNGD